MSGYKLSQFHKYTRAELELMRSDAMRDGNTALYETCVTELLLRHDGTYAFVYHRYWARVLVALALTGVAALIAVLLKPYLEM